MSSLGTVPSGYRSPFVGVSVTFRRGIGHLSAGYRSLLTLQHVEFIDDTGAGKGKREKKNKREARPSVDRRSVEQSGSAPEGRKLESCSHYEPEICSCFRANTLIFQAIQDGTVCALTLKATEGYMYTGGKGYSPPASPTPPGWQKAGACGGRRGLAIYQI